MRTTIHRVGGVCRFVGAGIMVVLAFLIVGGCGSRVEPEGANVDQTPHSKPLNDSPVRGEILNQPPQWAVTLPHSHSLREFVAPNLKLDSNGAVTGVELTEKSNRLHLITPVTLTSDFRVDLELEQLSVSDSDSTLKVGFRPVDGTLATVHHQLDEAQFTSTSISILRIRGRVGILVNDKAIAPKGVRNSASGHVFIELQRPIKFRVAINKMEGESRMEARTLEQPGSPIQITPKDWILLDERTRIQAEDSSRLRVVEQSGRLTLSTTESIPQIVCFQQGLTGDFYFATRVFLPPGSDQVGVCVVPSDDGQSVSAYKRSSDEAGDVWFIEIVRRGGEIRMFRDGGRLKKLVYDGSESEVRFGFSLPGAYMIQLDSFRFEALPTPAP